jgi:hypothetical protein
MANCEVPAGTSANIGAVTTAPLSLLLMVKLALAI